MNYYRDEPNIGVNNDINYSIGDSKSFDYTTEFIESVTNSNLIKKNVKLVEPLKHLSNFWKTLNILLINCEITLVLKWTENCVLTRKSKRNANYENDPVVYRIDDSTNTTFQITDTKLYVPVVLCQMNVITNFWIN